MTKPIAKWLLDNLISEPYSESHFKHNAEYWNKAEEIEKKEKLKNQLFFGKVSDILGWDKTLELLIEAQNDLKL
jgi:hypothetical protein